MAAILAAADFFNYGRAKNSMWNARAVFDGPLFTLPAGPARAAGGVEYTREELESQIQQNTSANLALIPVGKVSHNIKSAFAELNIPLLGGEGSMIHSLSVAVSGRYDDYSDYGHTFNPKYGIDFAPWSWLMLHANWGKSFQAPSLSASSALSPASLTNFGFVALPESRGAVHGRADHGRAWRRQRSAGAAKSQDIFSRF